MLVLFRRKYCTRARFIGEINDTKKPILSNYGIKELILFVCVGHQIIPLITITKQEDLSKIRLLFFTRVLPVYSSATKAK